MLGKKLALAAVLVATATGFAGAADLPVKAMKPAPLAPFFFVNDNSMSMSYFFTATDPGVAKTGKKVLTFTHFDVWAYGTNFLNIDLLKSGASDPATNVNNGFAPGGFVASPTGATEIYGFYRSTIGFNQLFNTKMFSAGPLTNVSFVWGGDANTENNTASPMKRDLVAGLEFDFALLYKGTFSASFEAYKEWNHFGFFASNSGNTDFNTTWRLEGAYTQPLDVFIPVPLTFNTVYGINGPKGSGNPDALNPLTPFVGFTGTSKPEYFVSPKLTLDVGKLAGQRPGLASVYVAYRYWVNKFGADPTYTTFTKECSWATGFTLAF
jgi:hypothetical protein